MEADGAVSPDAVVSPSATANAADPAAEPTDTSPTPEGADPAPAPEPAPSPTPEAPAPAPSPTAAPIPAAPAETTAPLELDGTEYTPGELIDLTNRVVELPDAPYAFAEGATVAEVSVVGITWTNEGRDDDVTVYMRASTDQGWDEWTVYESAESAPEDPIGGTDPIVVLDAGIEIQVAATYGDAPPEGLELSIVDPGESEADAEATVDSTGAAGQFSPMSVGTRGSPVIYTRSDWGADPQYMKWAPKNVTVAGVVVHHTAGSNGYTASAVPGIIRGIYYYHSVTRGWGTSATTSWWTPTAASGRGGPAA